MSTAISGQMTSDSFCTSRMCISVGLGLVGAGVSAIALIILGNQGYISMTTAYISSSCAGISGIFIAIAVATACSKSRVPQEDSPSLSVHQRRVEWVPDRVEADPGALLPPACFRKLFVDSDIPLEVSTPEEITAWLESDAPLCHYYSYCFHPPDHDHPYAHIKMSFYAYIEGKNPFLFKDVCFLNRFKAEGWEVTFEYNHKSYTKKACSKYMGENPILSEWRTIERDFFDELEGGLLSFAYHNGHFLPKDIKILKEDGYNAALFNDPLHSEVVVLRENGSPHKEVCQAFKIPGILEASIHENCVIFTRDPTKDPVQLQHLDAHPALQDKLRSSKWSWNFPLQATAKKVAIHEAIAFVKYKLPPS